MPKRLPKLPQDLSDQQYQYFESLNTAEDFPAILIAVSYVDECLASVLASKFLRGSVADELLNSTSGAIGTFAVKAKLVYVLGIVKKEMYKDLIKMVEIRNLVAHNIRLLSFDSEEIRKKVDEFVLTPTISQTITIGPRVDKPEPSVRNKFIQQAVLIGNHLLIEALKLQNKRIR